MLMNVGVGVLIAGTVTVYLGAWLIITAAGRVDPTPVTEPAGLTWSNHGTGNFPAIIRRNKDEYQCRTADDSQDLPPEVCDEMKKSFHLYDTYNAKD